MNVLLISAKADHPSGGIASTRNPLELSGAKKCNFIQRCLLDEKNMYKFKKEELPVS